MKRLDIASAIKDLELTSEKYYTLLSVIEGIGRMAKKEVREMKVEPWGCDE